MTVIQRRPRGGLAKVWIVWLRGGYTIWGRSKLSLPIVLKTKSWSLFTIPSKSSPRDAILVRCGRFGEPGSKKSSGEFDMSRRRRFWIVSLWLATAIEARYKTLKEISGQCEALYPVVMVEVAPGGNFLGLYLYLLPISKVINSLCRSPSRATIPAPRPRPESTSGPKASSYKCYMPSTTTTITTTAANPFNILFLNCAINRGSYMPAISC